MPIERKTNTSEDAISSLLDTIGAVAAVECKDNPELLKQVQDMTDKAKDSNLMTAAALQDDAIAAYHEAAEAEAAEAEAAEAEATQEDEM